MRSGTLLGMPGADGRAARQTAIEFVEGTTVEQLLSSMPTTARAYWGGVEITTGEAPAGIVLVPSVAVLETLFWIALYVGSALLSAQMAKDGAAAALRDAQRQDASDSGSANFRSAQSTRYGRGWVVPIVFGRWRVSGQVINLDVVQESGQLGEVEILHAMVMLCEGRIARIGDVSGGSLGEADELGTLDTGGVLPRQIPTGIRMDGVDITSIGTEVSVRMGSNAQSRIPKWPFAATTEQVNAEMSQRDDQRIVTMEQTDASILSIILDFPGGLYRRSSGGASSGYSVRFQVATRRVGTVAWIIHSDIWVVTGPRTRSLAWQENIEVSPGGAHQVRLTRLTESGDPGEVVSQCTWRSVTAIQWHTLTYPGCAIMAISRSGATRSAAQRAEFSAQVDGRLVRGWDSATGWTAETWDAVSPWVYPLGRNPAWVAVELLTNRDYGIANEIILWLGGSGDEELDLVRFREWADFCDLEDPSDNTRAHLEFNHALDVSRPAMEWLMAIFQAGHATPILEGGRLSVTYEYRDAHGRGTVSVPAREAYQILSTTNVESCELVFRDPSSLPNIIECEFFDEENDYLPDVVTMNDESRLGVAYVGDTPRVIVEKVSAIGPTSRAAVRREAWYQLQWMTSLVEARIKGGLALATVTVGDLFWLQHDCWSPANPDGYTGAMRTVTDSPGSDVTSLVLDRDIVSESPARSGTGLFVADLAGRARLLTIDGTGTYAAGDSIPLWDPVTGAPPVGFRCRRDATAAYGQFGTFQRRMKVVSLSLDPDYRVELVATEWPEAAFDDPPEEESTDDGATAAAPLSDADAMPTPAPPVETDLADPAPTLVMGGRGEPILSWQRQPTAGAQDATGAVRVMVRREGDRGWDLVAQAQGSAALHTDLEPETWHEAVALAPRYGGGYPDPSDVTPALVFRPELWGDLLAAPTGLVADIDGLSTTLAWGVVSGAVRYEVRRGGAWIEARSLAVVTEATVRLRLPPGTHRIMVRAEAGGGRWGQEATLSVVVAEPITEVSALVELPTVAGSHDGTEIVDGTLRLVDGAMRGVYTAPALAADGKAALSWSAIVDGDALELEQIGDDDGRIGEDWGAQIGGRRASPMRPGTAGATIGADTGTIGEWTSTEIRQGIANVGTRATARTEARWYDGASWSSWAPWSGEPTRREAEQIQVRVVLQRQHPRWRVAVDQIEVRASA